MKSRCNAVGITINGRFLTRPGPGVNRFAQELLRAWLPRHVRKDNISFTAPGSSPRPQGAEFAVPWRAAGSLTGHAWEQLQLSRNCGDDVLLSLCNTGPISRRRQLAVLHDASSMALPSAYSRSFRTWYRWLLAGLMRRAQVVATVSKFSAGELRRYTGVARATIEVIYESGEHVLDHPAAAGVLARLGVADRPYILAVGSRTPNKNLLGVIKAAGMLDDLGIKVVAAGGSHDRVFSGVDLTATSVVLAGYVTDGELRALYEGARCFVFPSYYEGFGLPPLEAMHCGCPAVVSRRASMPEVCGDAVVYCDPDDPADIARQLRRVLTSASLREELRQAGFARARTFSWAHAAAQLEDILTRNFAWAGAREAAAC
jgi:glycosyltransferase involved in cell wall biosynthesis